MSANDTSALRRLLTGLQRVDRRLTRSARVLRGGWVWLAVLLAVVVLDAAWSLVGSWWWAGDGTVIEMPGAARAWLGAALGIGLALVGLRWRLPRVVRRRTPADYAAMCERRLRMRGNELLAALNLHPLASDGSAFASGLAVRSVERGDQLAAAVRPADVRGPDDVRREAKGLAVVAGCWLVLTLVWLILPVYPATPAASLLRVADPYGWHRPAGWTVFDMKIEPVPVDKGDDVRLTVRATGRAVERATLLVLSAADRPQRLELRPSAEETQTWRTTLRDLRETVRVAVEAGGTRSEPHPIKPVDLPDILGVQLTAVDGGAAPREVPYEPGATVRLPVGRSLRVEMDSDLAEASIDHPDASGRAVTVPVTEGDTAVELRLTTPEGYRSREAVRFALRGVPPSAARDLPAADAAGPDRPDVPPSPAGEGDRPPDAFAPADSGEADAAAPRRAATPRGDATTDPDAPPAGQGPAETATREGRGEAATAEASAADAADAYAGGEAEGRDTPTPSDQPTAGVLAETVAARGGEASPAALGPVDRAPPGYRRLVGLYFQRLAQPEDRAGKNE